MGRSRVGRRDAQLWPVAWFVALALAAFSAWTAFGAPVLEDRLNVLPAELVELIAARRPKPLAASKVSQQVTKLLYPYLRSAEPDTWKLVTLEGYWRAVDHAAALEDVRILFEMLKYGYAGYQLFGGDAAFGEARKHLEEALLREPEPIAPSRMHEHVLEHLGFVQDGHFGVDGVSPLRRLYGLSTREFHAEPVGGRWRLRSSVSGEALGWLVEVNGEPPVKYVQPWVEVTGEVVYRLGARAASPPVSLELVIDTEEGLTRLPIALLPIDTQASLAGGTHGTYTREGIPVVVNRGMGTETERMRNEELIAVAGALRGAGCWILDLRANRGGEFSLAMRWLQAYLGTDTRLPPQSVPYKSVKLMTQTAFALNLRRTLPEGLRGNTSYPELGLSGLLRKLEEIPKSLPLVDWIAQALQIVAEVDPTTPRDVGAFMERSLAGVPVWLWGVFGSITRLPNPAVAVVLVDGQTHSAAEWFVLLLQRMENVLVLGTPTGGVLTLGDPVGFALPNSGVSISMGTALALSDDLVVREGRGVEPDLWVDPAHALDAAIAFLRRHFGCGE